MLVTKHELDARFGLHDLDARQKAATDIVRASARALATTIMERVPPSREQSLALTKLEEAMFWANAGIARNSQDPEKMTP